MFNDRINVQICSSVKPIEYVCKYVNKGSDMAVFTVIFVKRYLSFRNQRRRMKLTLAERKSLRIILATKNDIVNGINNIIQEMNLGEEKSTYQ
ncbi:hypothetical protein EVAR_75483_1 [Eumeta japonica]|uniref:Uncharacterized protein n=1 Tax=Eumeta variegata TaxID=151549 RepID=A0A4C1TN32_EUMVA|nr:hypothetical protein EVAR_75483_1 [Eumeta japonica]